MSEGPSEPMKLPTFEPTGEYRKPRKGEVFYMKGEGGGISTALWDFVTSEHHIYRRHADSDRVPVSDDGIGGGILPVNTRKKLVRRCGGKPGEPWCGDSSPKRLHPVGDPPYKRNAASCRQCPGCPDCAPAPACADEAAEGVVAEVVEVYPYPDGLRFKLHARYEPGKVTSVTFGVGQRVRVVVGEGKPNV